MAHLLKKFGEGVLKPRFVNGLWHKPNISKRVAAVLKKTALFQGQEWPYPEPEKPQHPTKPRGPFGQYKRPKGHKHEKAKQQRLLDIEKALAEQPKKIAEYRESRKIRPPSTLDLLLLRPKEIRMKQYRETTKR
ncbi:hypothetical protein WJX81_001356 [Elliptochloris bilobata]|uniref:Large ribosomal subunit protein mL59 domain-containing protein n=1 Tax=Elliptochloris bilobata TaxID=381761 RepID=A0AAW1QNK1_9CHLO